MVSQGGFVVEGGRMARAPGLHFLDLTRQRPGPSRPQHGVPLFVGCGRLTDAAPLSARPALEIDRWEQFEAWLEGTPGGYLAEAVRGFFVNQGRRCLVLPVAATDAALIEPFAEGGAVEDIADIDLVCVPDAVSSLCEAPADVQQAVVRHCEAMADRFAILDAPIAGDWPAADGGHSDGEQLRGLLRLPASRFAAIYFPGVWVEPGRTGRMAGEAALLVPPSGHVAGIYARSDAHTGVHKSPANEIVEGALRLQHRVDEVDHARLNDAGINCIRSMPGRGIRVMGARTLSRLPAWQYVSVARLFIGLTQWLKNDMSSTVFESQTPELWQQVQRRIASYCADLLQAGSLVGDGPGDAFFVKCDAETNPPDSRDAGQVVAHVGLAPSVPAEFVEVRITHDASGIAVTGI